ncbi:MAG: glutamate--tRNA ligase [Oscillospiraceae bacterium]|jgi:glutamyl-tRNA synthetase|nr:glutamate--tRNA ligase [Oscillospiraceae bacterium]
MPLDKTWFDEMEQKIPRGGVRTRFAPSPTGYMHVGNLRTALYAYLIARRAGGTFILRIEDTDRARQVEGAEALIYKTLRDCGIAHDEGPDLGGPCPPYVQSERREIYARYAEYLTALGGAYRDAEFPDVIRQKIPEAGETTFHDLVFGDITTPNDSLDDNVLIKSDGLPTYNFANVVDDHLMGITHVVRGSEYLSSAPKYNLLYASFGWTPPAYIHCAPVMRDKQNKMSKRHGDPSFEDLAAQGYLPEAVVNYVALLGWSPGGEREIFSLAELCEAFEISGISKSPAIFDAEKLTYFNAEYIRAMTPEAFAAAAAPYINHPAENARLAALVQQRCEKLTDIPEKIDFFDALPDYSAELYVHKKSKTDEASSLDALQKSLPVLEALPDWSEDALHAVLSSLAETLGVKSAALMWPLRVAASGKAVTPGGATQLCAVLGREETLRRVAAGLEKLKGTL